MERYFAIMEVKQAEPMNQNESDLTRYIPVDQRSSPERLWLDPSRIIPSSRLWYGTPKKDDRFLNNKMYWVVASSDWVEDTRLILDPEPEPEPEKDEFEKWFDDCPAVVPDSALNAIRDWFKIFPRSQP